jgi:hypothetical protein
VTDGLLLWLDAGDSATLFQDTAMTMAAADGDPVALWLDKSGNNYHATQADAALVPVASATGMNGAPTLSFSGADGDGMVIDDGLSLARPYSAFIVNQYTGDVRGRTLQGQDANWLLGLWSANISAYADGFIGSNSAAEVNTPYVVDSTGDAAGNSTLYVNGLDSTVNSAPMGAPGRLALGSGGMFPAEVSDADVSEIVVYDRVLTDTELGDVRDFLYAKYSPTILAPPAPQNTVFAGQLGVFTGGDAGEGLDLSGNFVYAINVGGPAATAGDAMFTDGSEAGILGGSTPGASITDANEIPAWHAPAYGDSADDDGIETVATSIRWNVPPGLNIDLDVEAGAEYKVQLLFAENCCDRGFDITIEDELLVDNFNIPLTQDGIANTAQGVVFTHTLVAGDGQLNILLGGPNPLAPDNNPTLSGLTVEKVPEPSSLVLLLVGMLGLSSWLRGHRG